MQYKEGDGNQVLPAVFREFYRKSDDPVLSLTITRQNDAWTGALLKFFCHVRYYQSLRKYSASANNT